MVLDSELEEMIAAAIAEGGPPVRCLHCRAVIRSEHRYDFVSCTCGRVSVDGGAEASRILTHKSDSSWEDA